MITRLTKIQLMIFLVVTLIGGAVVGGRYAKVDRFFVDRSYPVTVQLENSGGLFAGAQVTYRGLGVGRVKKMTFKDAGVEALLDIENSAPKIPDDILAVVANKSAVGEQYMDLQPRSNAAPYLKAGANITVDDTKLPIPTTQLLVNVTDLVSSIDTDSLKTVVNELGTAFQGTGEDLGRIVDTTTSFIETANDNIDVTRALIQDSNTVLQTQVDKGSEIQTFSKNLALLSDTLVDSDKDIRRLLDEGPAAAKTVRQVVDENDEDLTVLINNLVTTNRPLFENTQAVRALFILFPYLVEGAPSALIQDKKTGDYQAAFGLVGLPPTAGNMSPVVCTEGYNSSERETKKVAREFNIEADCTDGKLVPRNPNDATGTTIPKRNRASVGGYDSDLTSTPAGAAASRTAGKDSWKWLLLGPTMQ